MKSADGHDFPRLVSFDCGCGVHMAGCGVCGEPGFHAWSAETRLWHRISGGAGCICREYGIRPKLWAGERGSRTRVKLGGDTMTLAASMRHDASAPVAFPHLVTTITYTKIV